MDSKAFDEHGHIDVIEEPWLDLSFEPGSPQITINGASLQTLLKGMFILHSNYRSNDVLPGGITPWREAAPVVFTTLFHIASISQMMSRVYLVMDKHTKMNEDPSYGLHLDRTEVEATAQGALTFISFMVSHFRSHIKDLHMLEIRDSVENLADLCQSGEEVKELHARLLTDINALTTRFTLLNEFGPAKARDEMLMPRIEHYRHFGSERLEDVTHDSEIRDIFGGAAAGKGDGVWDSDSDEGTGSAIRDPRPEIDMENGISLTDRVVPSLSEHMGRFMIIVNTFSVLEIARQWTLMDHRLFCKIKLPTLLHTDDRGDIECNWEVPRYIQGARGVRGFVDQFDTEVRWVYSAVLDPHRDGSHTTSDERAGVIEWLIELASELLRLNNFSGLMATISGLDQPGVRRLGDTWSHVSTEAKRKLNDMREIMAPKNNYSMYRQEIARRFEGFHLRQGAELYYSDFDNDLQANSAAKRASRRHRDSILLSNNQGSKRDGASAVVPHLASHLSDLMAIVEGNSQYVEGHIHLFNFTRLSQISQCIGLLGQAQQLTYTLRYVRMLASALCLEFSPLYCVSEDAVKEINEDLWERSLEIEGTGG